MGLFWFKVVIAVNFIAGLCNCALLKGPADRTVYIGEHVVLTCQTNLTYTVFWYFNGKEIFYGGKISMQYAEYFKMQSMSVGEYNLVIPHATTWYAGIYECADDEGEGEKRSARLVVSESSNIVTEGSAGVSAQSNNTTIIIVAIAISSVVVLILIIGAVLYFYCCTDKCKKHHEAADESADAENLLNKNDGVRVSLSKSTETHLNKPEGMPLTLSIDNDQTNKIDIPVRLNTCHQNKRFPDSSKRSSLESEIANSLPEVPSMKDNSPVYPIVCTISKPDTDQQATGIEKAPVELNETKTPQETKKAGKVEDVHTHGMVQGMVNNYEAMNSPKGKDETVSSNSELKGAAAFRNGHEQGGTRSEANETVTETPGDESSHGDTSGTEVIPPFRVKARVASIEKGDTDTSTQS